METDSLHDTRTAFSILASDLLSAIFSLVSYPLRRSKQLINQAFSNGYNLGRVHGQSEGYCVGIEEGFLLGKQWIQGQPNTPAPDDGKPYTDRWKDI